MKLKYNFVVRNIDGRPVAVAVGKDNAEFNGMIRLNDTGKFIFDLLSVDTTEADIVAGLTDNYEVDKSEAESAVKEFLQKLRDNGLLVE
ncbi:MAG: PqqD family protein [Ruminococcaceae bacterium]|nr:PqqD family protein [Oscillospiraceae bacterium]